MVRWKSNLAGLVSSVGFAFVEKQGAICVCAGRPLLYPGALLDHSRELQVGERGLPEAEEP